MNCPGVITEESWRTQVSFYTTEDPQLLISGIVEGTSRLYVELSVQTISPDAAYACMNLLNRVRRAERL